VHLTSAACSDVRHECCDLMKVFLSYVAQSGKQATMALILAAPARGSRASYAYVSDCAMPQSLQN